MLSDRSYNVYVSYADTFDCHTRPAGKVGVVAKPINSKADLSAAYTPGVAEVCLRIKHDVALAAEYTNIWNRVLVVSDGTATLGLGNTGPLASKPVMEGKVALMSALAGIDAVDLVCDPSCVRDTVQLVAQNFGAINLEDIAAPACFEDCAVLSRALDIAVFHDDQYGTAVVVAAALESALQKVGKALKDVRLVISGAGASAQASAKLLMYMGLRAENLWMFDSRGLLTCNRDLDKHKQQFARVEHAEMSYAEALRGADVFIGLSKAGVLDVQDIAAMADRPIVFALANPVPEIDVRAARLVRPDAIYATGSSADPNQVNNVLCFPFLLRGVLDVRACTVNMEMLCACVRALREIPADHLLPDVFDWQLLFGVSAAVVKAATETGVARAPLTDLRRYKWQLLFRMLGLERCQVPDYPFPEGLSSVAGECSVVVCYARHSAPLCFALDLTDLPQHVMQLPGLRVLEANVATLQDATQIGSDYTQYAKVGDRWHVCGGSPRGLLVGCLLQA